MQDYAASSWTTPEYSDFLEDTIAGLNASPKCLKPKYFYDKLGSALFERICSQPEYYLTRVESQILKNQSQKIVDAIRGGAEAVNIVELGSGSSIKTRILFRALLNSQNRKLQIQYYPVDISETALVESANLITGDFPSIKVEEIVGSYESGLKEAFVRITQKSNWDAHRSVILFLGSSIGNLNPEEARVFLQMLAASMRDSDALLIGFDLEKNIRTLERAYDDKAGVTAAFNLNILARINSELGGTFDLGSFSHRAFYNAAQHRIEMHLVSVRDQAVRLGVTGDIFSFEKGETIHTESSYKYSLSRIRSLAASCGLAVKRHFTDRKGWYDLCMLSKKKAPDTDSKS